MRRKTFGRHRWEGGTEREVHSLYLRSKSPLRERSSDSDPHWVVFKIEFTGSGKIFTTCSGKNETKVWFL